MKKNKTPTYLHRHMRNKRTQTQVCLAAHGDDLQIEMFHWLTSKIYKVLEGGNKPVCSKEMLFNKDVPIINRGQRKHLCKPLLEQLEWLY